MKQLQQPTGRRRSMARADVAQREEIEDTLRVLLALVPLVRALLRGAGDVERGALGLTPRQVQALCVLYLEPELSVSELAARLGMALAGASQLVAQLAALELVRREEDPSDHRRTMVVPGPCFDEIFEPHIGARLRPLAHALSRLDPQDRVCLVRGLGTVSEIVATSFAEQPGSGRCWREGSVERSRG